MVRVLHNVRVHAILEILLHVCIEEEIQAGNIAEGDVLSEGGALLVAKRFEQLEMQVTDFFLCN